MPRIRFADVTEQAGINFVHVNGAAGEKLLPETMGGGCAFFDYDNDGRADVLLVNSRPWDPAAVEGPAPTMALYHNQGDGRFSDVTRGSGLDVSLYGMGAATGDFDNDGLADVFVTAVGGNRLFRNLGGGRFQDVTPAANVGGDGGWSTGAAFVDVDRDGLLDLFVCNYVVWDRRTDAGQQFMIPGVGRAYGPPLAFPGTHCRLYRNTGGGTFSDVSEAAGVLVTNPATRRPAGKSLAVAPADLDGDGWIDLVVANDTVPNFVFHNRGDGTFREVGVKAGLAYNNSGEVRGAMGIDTAFFRNDESLGVAVGNFAGELNALYVSQGPLQAMSFRDDAMSTGVAGATRNVLTFGLFFFDADLDGRLDLLMANGHIEPQIDELRGPQTYRQPALLLWNRRGAAAPGRGGGGEDFVPLTAAECGPDLLRPLASRGAAYADIDGDGDLDVLITQVAGPARLFRNDQALGHHWLRVRLVGDPSRRVNRDGIGAWVEAEVAGASLRRQVMPTRSYLSQVELPVTIGLGPHARVDRLSVLWPDGTRQQVDGARVDAETTVRYAAAEQTK